VIYSCCDAGRREAVRNHPTVNGLDFLEVLDHAVSEAERQRKLEVHFVKPLGAFALTLTKGNIRIEGGERIQNITVRNIIPGVGPHANVLTVEVDQPGDFSPYLLRLVRDKDHPTAPDDIDPQLASITFSFKVECPSPFDCAPQHVCPPEQVDAPDIDYLAKDFASFKRLMLDRMAVTMPAWKERNAADIGVMLVEALAYSADQLSYQQDAVATEAYLHTARKRISVRRHARLLDYFISEGCNARTWVHVEVSMDISSTDPDTPLIPTGTALYTGIPEMKVQVPGNAPLSRETDTVFETMEPLQFLYASHNTLSFYSWSDTRCCLPKGATRATLKDDNPQGRLRLRPGDILMFEEVLGPVTGVEADADIARRHAVRLTRVSPEAKPILKKNKDKQKVEVGRTPDTLQTDIVTGQAIVDIEWAPEDALPFAFCLSAETSQGYREDVSVARGNLVLADYGLTYQDSPKIAPEPYMFSVSPAHRDRCQTVPPEPILPRFRPRLDHGPLTHAAPAYDHSLPARRALQWSLRDAQPAITLTSTAGTDSAVWTARRDLLNSSDSATEFVAEIDNDGVATIRFGDAVHGRRPEPGTAFVARYRVGNGRAGNIGADSLTHIATNRPEITGVRNPLPAQGGQDPESLEDVRQRAPVAYRVQERAVTPADYAAVTERHADVQRAAATFRWTGSWRTVFLTVDRSAGAALSKAFEKDIGNHVERYRMAGHDIEVDEPQFVALEIDMHVCVASDHFRSHVLRELFEVFSNRDLPDGRRGLFHPDNVTFGQPVYLSAIYAAAHQVAGVESVEVRTFQRLGAPDNTALESGRLDIHRLEIARLDNDRNYPERGQLTISLGGGK
jgi:hypothetical protein